MNGVDRNPTNGKKFRVWQLGQLDVGRLLLDADLTDASGSPLPAGTDDFTFFGILESAPAGGGVSAPAPAPSVGSVGNFENALTRLRDRLDRVSEIDNPQKRKRATQRLRTWMKIVRRGVDPSSPEGRIKRQLVNARSLADEDRRRRLVDRLITKLDELDE